jgi:hypothetical protein
MVLLYGFGRLDVPGGGLLLDRLYSRDLRDLLHLW